MKHLKKLNSKGFAHWVIPALAVLVIGGIGTYLLTASRADTLPKYTASSVCGSGYSAVYQSQGVPAAVNNYWGANGAYVSKTSLLINRSIQKLCAVNLSTGSTYGVAKQMSVSIYITPKTSLKTITRAGQSNSGSFKYYAGPVYVSYAGLSSSQYQVTVKSRSGTSVAYNEIGATW